MTISFNKFTIHSSRGNHRMLNLRDSLLAKSSQRRTLAISSNGIEGILYVERGFAEHRPAVLQLVCTNNNAASIEDFHLQIAVTKVVLSIPNLVENGEGRQKLMAYSQILLTQWCEPTSCSL